MSRTLAYCNWLIGIVRPVYAFSQFMNTVTPGLTDGSSRPPSIEDLPPRALLDTVMPIRQMCLLWSAAPKCALLRREPSTALSEKPTGSVSARLKSWDGSSSAPSLSDNHARPIKPCASNGSNNGHPRLRDKLCLLIRKYELDPTLVKRYAADFCGTEALRDASRDLVEAFISTLAEEAAKDRAALVCKLNSYNQLEEVKS